jgi:hypothetical protein
MGAQEYVLVRTDLDTLLMPLLEMLYNAPKRTANQIYMLLIILLILSQDSSFNANIHKLVLPAVPWYQERLLPNISLGSLVRPIISAHAAVSRRPPISLFRIAARTEGYTYVANGWPLSLDQGLFSVAHVPSPNVARPPHATRIELVTLGTRPCRGLPTPAHGR